MHDEIYIIGAGAIGKALAVFLARAGRRVRLVRGSIDDKASRRERIRVVASDGTAPDAEIEVTTLNRIPRLDGIVVLATKSFGNRTLARALEGKTGASPIVVLQNGLGVETPFVERGFADIHRCVLFATSQIGAAGEISFKPVAVSPIGVVKGRAENLKRVVAALDNPVFPFAIETDIQTVIWKKAIINSVFNSVCPLLEVDNGVFHRDARALAVARRVIAECVAVAREKGVLLDAEEVTERLLLISRASDGQLISTWQDILNGRPTEIDTLNFAVVETARALGKEHSVTETKLLGELTKLKADLSVKK